ncbi:MAG: DUF1491 family protein [Phreatobacter sp.]|uniref:DUF1491 family protein n=1 Tax=Phreatobacter sp. TaxID=1966341 RepID=UPI001A60E3D8|nr:DUF1491 family protein [Phreatobacter sp.]MBL8568760.1 DUF1491 family protein [Phreatobacter sp.]
MARLTSEFWVAAFIRRVNLEGGFATLRKRGAAEAGAIAVTVSRASDRLVALYLQAPQTAFGEERPVDRLFVPAWPDVFVEEMKVAEKLTREQKFDPDLWIVDVDDRDGRPFVEIAAT